MNIMHMEVLPADRPVLPGLDKFCERRPVHAHEIATHLMERMECTRCGFREVIYICAQCKKDVDRLIANPDKSVNCLKCFMLKPHGSIRIIGRA